MWLTSFSCRQAIYSFADLFCSHTSFRLCDHNYVRIEHDVNIKEKMELHVNEILRSEFVCILVVRIINAI